MEAILIGLGCGTWDTLTCGALDALKQAELVIGARRLLESLPEGISAECCPAVRGTEILELLRRSGAERAAVVYSGDTGFYSGTRTLVPLLEEAGISFRILPGISSVQYFAAVLHRPWQDWNLVSAHGVDCDPVTAVMQGKPAFFLTGGELTPKELCIRLTRAGLKDLPVTVGENLTYESERLVAGTAETLAQQEYAPLSVMLAEAAPEPEAWTSGIGDEEFIRGDVPMTKEEVRAAAVSRLRIRPADVVWDVGAGTGSVSVAMARAARQGHVYAVERLPEACDLIRANRDRFGTWNLTIVQGMAEEAIHELPAPDAVFIGGSRGQMGAVIRGALQANPKARILISSILIETLGEAVAELTRAGLSVSVVQIAASTSKNVGKKHMMLAGNPIFLIGGEKK